VVRPESTAAVAAIVAACARTRTAVVPQGGNTGLVGGGVPLHGEVVVHLGRLNGMGPVDHAAGQVTVGAGVTLAALHGHVAAAGWAFGVDLGARDSCTIGGMVATNAGGINVVRYGMMRRQVVGVEAVLGDGSVVSHLSGLAKDNTGYDLAGLLTGSEGTLGVICRVRLQLVAMLPERATAVLGVGDWDTAIAVATTLRDRLDQLMAVEVMTAAGVGLVSDEILGHRLGIDALQAPVVLLVEVADRHDPMDGLVEAVADLELAAEPAVAATPEQRRRIWAIRERHAEAIARRGLPVKLDVSVPLDRMAGFVAALTSALPIDLDLVVFGHILDGNLHVNVTGVDEHDAERTHEVECWVLGEVVAVGGSVSAEHGIGTAKAEFLSWSRSAAEIAAFRAIKSALDPLKILNPWAVVPES
jgi:FAD/FMN-containing dehydrogenase